MPPSFPHRVSCSCSPLFLVLTLPYRASQARQPGVFRLVPPRCRHQSLLATPCDVDCSFCSSLSPSACVFRRRTVGVLTLPPSMPPSFSLPLDTTPFGLSARAPLGACEAFRLLLSPAAPKTLLAASTIDSTSIRFVGRLAKACVTQIRGEDGTE